MWLNQFWPRGQHSVLLNLYSQLVTSLCFNAWPKCHLFCDDSTNLKVSPFSRPSWPFILPIFIRCILFQPWRQLYNLASVLSAYVLWGRQTSSRHLYHYIRKAQSNNLRGAGDNFGVYLAHSPHSKTDHHSGVKPGEYVYVMCLSHLAVADWLRENS